MVKLEFILKHEFLLDDDRCFKEDSGVYLANDIVLKRKVIIKTQKINNEKELERVKSEATAMVMVGSEGVNVPHIYETFYDKDRKRYFIVMEYIDGKTLDCHVDERTFIGYMIDLCEIMSKLEKNKLSHKDIKPDNIMIRNGKLYLIDFNISINAPNLVEGTDTYKAPEMDYNSISTNRRKVDYFSIGAMMYDHYTNTVPVRGYDYSVDGENKKQWDYFNEPISVNQQMSQEANDIIVKCMKLNPDERYDNFNQMKSDLIRLRKKIKNGNRKQ